MIENKIKQNTNYVAVGAGTMMTLGHEMHKNLELRALSASVANSSVQEVSKRSGGFPNWPVGSLFMLPSFVISSEISCLQSVLASAGAGIFSGESYSALLLRAEIRFDIALKVHRAKLPVKVSRAVYLESVALAEEGVFGCKLKVFETAVAELLVINKLSAGCVRARRMCDVQGPLRDMVKVRQLAPGAAIACVSSIKDNSDVPADSVVMPEGVFMGMARMQYDSSGVQPRLSLSRRADGVFFVKSGGDRSSSYNLSQLPNGLYELPGAYGLAVPVGVFQDYCVTVFGLPHLSSREGFCYLACLPPSRRWDVAMELGPDITREVLSRVCPDAADWSPTEAQFVERVDAHGRLVYHVVKPGSLPSAIPLGGIIGSGGLDPVQNKIDDVLAGMMSQIVTPPISVGSPSRGSVASAHTRSMSSGSNFSVGSTVSRYVREDETSYRPNWQQVLDPSSSEWLRRLAEGPPVGGHILRQLSRKSNSINVSPPPAEGVSIHVLPYLGPLQPSLVAKWEPRRTPLDGWNFEMFDFSREKLRRCLFTHPDLGSTGLCRYELACDDPVVVNSSLTVPGNNSVVWASSSVLFDFTGSGKVIRAWCDSGAPGLGKLTRDVVKIFNVACVKNALSTIMTDRVVGLTLRSQESVSGLVKYGAIVQIKNGSDRIHLYLGDEVSEEVVVLTVKAYGLRYIVAHDVKVRAADGIARVALHCTQVTVQVCVKSEVDAVDAEVEFLSGRGDGGMQSVMAMGNRFVRQAIE